MFFFFFVFFCVSELSRNTTDFTINTWQEEEEEEEAKSKLFSITLS